MDRILLATDLSVRSDRALDRALLLAASCSAELHVIHNIVQSDPHLPKSHFKRDFDDATSRLERILEDTAGSDRAVTEYKVVAGNPVEEILNAAQVLKTDLIVMGLSRDFTFDTLLRGTTVDKVIAKSTAPVLVVKSRPKRDYCHALVALDQSFPSRSALVAALKLAPHAKFTVVHAVENKKAKRVELEHIEDQIMGIAQHCFEDILASADDSEYELEVHVDLGKGGDVVCNHVEKTKPDLVSFGRSNKSGLNALVIGSTARILIEHLQCDMIVAPAP